MPLSQRLFLFVLVMAPAAVSVAQAGPGIVWQTDLDAARATAEKEQKLLLVHFWNKSCGPCRVLEANVFNQPNVAAAVHPHYVPVKLDTNEYPATAERFGITKVPTDVVITPQGKVVERMVSPLTPMAYIGQMTGIAQQYKRNAGREFQTANTAAAGATALNSAYANLAVPADQNSFTQSQQPVPGQPGGPLAGMTTNPYATPQAPPATPPVAQPEPPQQVAPVAVANPYANQPQAPSAPIAPPAGDRYASAATAGGPVAGVTPPAVQPPPTAQPGLAVQSPQLPADSPPLGFFGFCPVTMQKENRWQQGDVRWGCYHRGRTYLFASQEARDEFLKGADEYAPALSGMDPVLAIDSGKAEAGKQEFGIEYEGRLYLFSSEDNLRKFFAQPKHYAGGVQQAMNATGGSTRR